MAVDSTTSARMRDDALRLFREPDPRPVHFVGIAGAGMSALAELFVRRGVTVTGSDMSPAGNADLEALGVTVHRGHDAAYVRGARAVVVSSAIPADHVEMVEAGALRLPVIRRAEALGAAVAGMQIVGIAGTHGKTTTTVMTTEALAGTSAAPTGIVGGRVHRWGGNLRWGGGTTVVVEADEYDRSFLALHPTIAVVTNVEADHLDIYTDLRDIVATFEAYLAEAHGVVLCADDPGANALAVPAQAELIRYGTDTPDARLVGIVEGDAMRIVFDGAPLGTLTLRVPGQHNRRNALAAIGAGLMLGHSFDALKPGLEAFVGVERRFERKGEVHGVLVIDDYAHHPTEVRATLEAARAAFPGRRIVALFQPHLYTRTRDFADDFGQALAAGTDCFALTDIYKAREHPIPGVTSTLIADAADRAGHAPDWLGSRRDATPALLALVRPGDVVLTMGAGDVTAVGPELLEALSARSA
ncbi:MAG: UDP-N-acetylmuramate--L-alanine ligase [Gemmatimonadaceae bacterium]|nr:UDP-N-acetylmuramate--L-alanine ligase [Gemmatimonadaceae bacterium]